MNMDSYQQALNQYSVSKEKAEAIIQAALAYEKPKAEKRIVVQISWAVAACLAIVVAVVGFRQATTPTPKEDFPVIYTSGTENNTSSSSAQASHEASKSEETTKATNNNTQSSNSIATTSTQLKNDIVWNDVELASAMMYKDPDAEHVTITFANFVELLGYDPTPAYIPAGFKQSPLGDQSVFFNPDGSPTEYYCFYGIGYTAAHGYMGVRVGPVLVDAHSDVPMEFDELKTTTINGVVYSFRKNVTPEKWEESKTADLMVSFQKKGNYYYVYSQGNVTEDEFLQMVLSL